MTGRYRENLSVALPGHFVRTVQPMGWSGLVNGKLLGTLATLQEPAFIQLKAEE